MRDQRKVGVFERMMIMDEGGAITDVCWLVGC